MSNKDGGPAFPFYKGDAIRGYVESHGLTGYNIENPGMTLRDWFAGQALSPLITISNQDMRERQLDSVLAYAKDSAVVAYAFADAMIAERAKG